MTTAERMIYRKGYTEGQAISLIDRHFQPADYMAVLGEVKKHCNTHELNVLEEITEIIEIASARLV